MKQIAPVSINEIARVSAKNIVMNHVDMLTATSKGVALEALKKRMMRGEVVKFAYQKLDGSIRIAVGTLQNDAVKANTVGTGVPKVSFGQFAYLDLEKMSWRSFKEERFIGTCEC